MDHTKFKVLVQDLSQRPSIPSLLMRSKLAHQLMQLPWQRDSQLKRVSWLVFHLELQFGQLVRLLRDLKTLVN